MGKRKNLLDSAEENDMNDEMEKPEFTSDIDIEPEVDVLDNEAEGEGETVPEGLVVPDVQLQVVEDGAIAHGPIENFAVQEVPNQQGAFNDVRVNADGAPANLDEDGNEIEEDEIREVEFESGRFVTFVLDAGPNIGEARPALVVRAWEGPQGEMLNLLVFTDTDEESRFNDRIGPILWRNSVSQGDGETVGTWF